MQLLGRLRHYPLFVAVGRLPNRIDFALRCTFKEIIDPDLPRQKENEVSAVMNSKLKVITDTTRDTASFKSGLEDSEVTTVKV